MGPVTPSPMARSSLPCSSCARRKRVSWSSPPRPQENTQDEGRRLRPVSLLQRLPAPRAHSRRADHGAPAPERSRSQAQVQPDRERSAFPPSDPDFPRLYRRRNDSESLNRSLEDTLFLGRDHSLGWRRQQVEMLGWAVRSTPSRWPATERLRPRSGRLTAFTSGTTRQGIKAVSGASPRPIRRYRARTHLHSLHFNALVMTSVAFLPGSSTGSAWPGSSVGRARG